MANEPKQPSKLPVVVGDEPSRDDGFTRQLAELLQTDSELKAISPQKRERLLTPFPGNSHRNCFQISLRSTAATGGFGAIQ
jgi:hypothetical protein